MTIVILYEEIASYILQCILTLSKNHEAKIVIIRKKVNNEAPFLLDLQNLTSFFQEDYSNEELISLLNEIKPDAIFCGGWSTPVYLKICKLYCKSIPTILGFDNKWTGSAKQLVAVIIARLFLTKKFTGCFVPGIEQKKYALKMGFKENLIETGAYSCDFELFYKQYLANKEKKQQHFPKRFIYVGRYYEFKGIKDLWQAFIELQNSEPNEWELWCFGVGDIIPIEHEKIKHFGFVQPSEMVNYIKDTGVFVLPSHFEPWGVVVHEFAAAGFPLLVSDEVGARIAFVEDGKNGYMFKSGEVKQLKQAMQRFMNKRQEELITMGEKSVAMAKQITPETWAKQLMKLIQHSKINTR